MKITVAKMIDTALMRCGIPTPMSNPELILRAKEALYFCLLDLVNRGVPIFMVKKFVMGLEPMKCIYDLPETYYDIFDLNWRTYRHTSMTPSGGGDPEALYDYDWSTFATATENYFTLSQTNPSYINYFGILPSNSITTGYTVEAAVNSSSSPQNWSTFPLVSSQDWINISYGNNTYITIAANSPFVALGNPLTLTWTQINTSFTQNWKQVIWTGRFFIAVAPGIDFAIVSDDGITWTSMILPTSDDWTGVIADSLGGIVIFANSSDSYVYTNNYGLGWTLASLPIVDNWVKGIYNEGVWIILAANSTNALASNSSSVWYVTTMPASLNWSGVTAGDNGYIAVANETTNAIAKSLDGFTWTPGALPNVYGWTDIAFANGIYMTVSASSNTSLFSLDGISWSTTLLPLSFNWISIATNGLNFVSCASGNTLAAIGSENLIEWQVLSEEPAADFIKNKWIWVDCNTPAYTSLIRIRFTNPSGDVQLKGFYVGNLQCAYEIMSAKMNRDDFFAYPSKGASGTPINYYFYKGNVPQMQLWQSPCGTNVFNWALNMYVLDVPQLEMELPIPLQDVPQWFIEGIIWLLAAKLAPTIPEVQMDRIAYLQQMSDKYVNEMESSNSDSSNINLLGTVVSQYTRK